jgi:hypothetical protein
MATMKGSSFSPAAFAGNIFHKNREISILTMKKKQQD